ncbi:hypothetical protein ACIQV3_36685 [Streptomyces sp. NPDC099050]|uniref:hypothetical protein n=1 Tax=Streptomyces sp. NPDC099050 TaxID=3366100 RepID=UPI003826B750
MDGAEELSLIGTAFPGCRSDVRDGEIHLTAPGGGEPVPTGDLGVLRPDGLLEFRGRIRDRLTADGKAFDPHPVESAIRSHQSVGAARNSAPYPQWALDRMTSPVSSAASPARAALSCAIS